MTSNAGQVCRTCMDLSYKLTVVMIGAVLDLQNVPTISLEDVADDPAVIEGGRYICCFDDTCMCIY